MSIFSFMTICETHNQKMSHFHWVMEMDVHFAGTFHHLGLGGCSSAMAEEAQWHCQLLRCSCSCFVSLKKGKFGLKQTLMWCWQTNRRLDPPQRLPSSCRLLRAWRAGCITPNLSAGAFKPWVALLAPIACPKRPTLRAHTSESLPVLPLELLA